MCDALLEIEAGCDNSFGGLDQNEILVADRKDITSVTEVAGEVTAISMSPTTKFVKLATTRDAASFTDNAEVDVTTGTTVYNQGLTIQMKRREVATRNGLLLLAAGQRDLVFIVRDNNNIHHLLGYSPNQSRGLQFTGDEGGSGTAPTDLSGFAPTFSAMMDTRPIPVDSSIVAALLTAAA